MLLLKRSHLGRFNRQYSNIRVKTKSNELSSIEIRNLFLDYFIEKHNHKFIRSSPVIPFCDPTVPFVNAGMNQFKNVFLDKAMAPSKTAANSQKCIRVGGKHNDLNVIGTDGYHHTFFEMLGNWSFGDYFKEKACKLAWDLLTNSYKIDPSRLYVTYFGGDNTLGLAPDLECKEIWRSIGVSENRILPFGAKDNFWEMGASGPCGSCSEIHIDHLPNSNAAQRAKFVNAGLADLTELWNIVFIEYNRKLDGSLEPLRTKFIDTGMGFERLVAVLQGKSSNYDTDLFFPIFDAISKESGKAAYSGIFNPNDSKYELDYAYRLIADHARMCSVCIADGMYPKTNQRLQKIMRKTLNTCEQYFGNNNIIQNAVIPKIVASLSPVYPELENKFKNICDVFAFEDEVYKSFIENNRKLFKGLKLPSRSQLKEDDVIDFANFSLAYRDIEKKLKSDPAMDSLSTEYLFEKLYTNFGLSDEVIQKLAAEMNLFVDMDEFAFYKRMKGTETKSRHEIEENTLFKEMETANISHTSYDHMYDYEFDNKSKQFIVRSLKANVLFIKRNGDLYDVILDQTNFYHTAGGQDSDHGKIISSDGKCIFNVENVEHHKGYVVHTGRFVNDTFKSMENVNLIIDAERRTHLSQHHTAMHLLQAAMKKITKQIIFQESSHVSATDLKCVLGTIGKRINLEQLQNIENLINEVIQSNTVIDIQCLVAHELYCTKNLTTMPGASYPDNGIRVVKVDDNMNEFESIEPCCGTHVKNTGELQEFCFTSFKVNNNQSYDITAVAGHLVQSIRNRNQEMSKSFELLKEKVNNEFNTEDEWESIQSDAIRMKRQLNETQMSYIIKAQILSELENLDKQIRTMKKAQIKQSMITEIVDVLAQRKKNNEPFIVHVLKTKYPLEDALFVDAEHMCNDLPVILINVSNGQIIQGRASIPSKYTHAEFNANHWIREFVDSFKIKCSAAKKKSHFNQSKLKDIPKQKIAPERLEVALQKTKALATKMFDKLVKADEMNRQSQAERLLERLSDIRSQLNKENSRDDLVKMNEQATIVRNDMNLDLYSYDVKAQCTNELIDIDQRIFGSQYEIEKDLFFPGVEKAIDESTLNEKPYFFHIINTDHALHHRTIMRISDLSEHLAMVLIIISNDAVTGRIHIPLKYTNLTAKYFSNEFNAKFNGKCIHDGTRYSTSVTDFQLKKDLVNEDSLKEVFNTVEGLFKKMFKK